MGYRSDVRIITTKDGFNELKKFTDKYLKNRDFNYENMLDNLDIDRETEYAKYFGWNSIKWYEGFHDVDAIMDGLNHLENKDYSYRYARIGESYDDYEEQSYESTNEKEQDLEYPYMMREFDDDIYLEDDKEIKNTNTIDTSNTFETNKEKENNIPDKNTKKIFEYER